MIPLPQPLKIIKKKENYALFEIKALWPGYGTTIGNTLRKILLSSLEGAAVTKVKIKGVSHEFSTIPGITEDILHILMNLKQLRFKVFSEEPQKVTLKQKGEKEVKGAALELPPQIELVNPNLTIATLSDKKASLEMELQVEKGVGYQVQELRKKGKMEIGDMALDAIFTPIKRVNYKVENMRVGGRTDFDRLEIEIETDGTITPENALQKAFDILLSHLTFLASNLEQKKETKGSLSKEIFQKSIKDLELSSKILNILLKNKIEKVPEILDKSEEELLSLKGMGKKGVKELKKSLEKIGLTLK
ncbi:MAG: DNA-directed RNA polymerase subunit alpha [Candidatus Nealsonbacteria bacterium CG_4_9_14_3_um_filter_35_11]|uniref:DNA-directed RNA polymerase subunit alpha n=2 Tax=Candidatus Nealsoniibacteriota TaxID=1817911 RepID=A0A2M7DBB4_9BACT|nr:MAG: DNA-directed RNA polymerase subunit alpha [Candidatus Nealsonbacteria bacterium CG02_land_8_20_14_3_00_34_20]PIW92651.1 MAG: DNA-directed RNA polymerase subunit alpha [Candidatus Nealsonbacteria bacterium CG_4_8_14_3_um_filter_34_13]PIZ90108.1 MAG: DNA-directed RNA polymerase subunit alpha [Candidatus Nealsonbacteria bacterium CG_4_10_14_0_2_um_filter_35_20]PJA84761.1 MAG: DNA-directed RNA polymerase subunit alpha [Candidatus Nealsonbacteria bacterium CG_4_9_14_3_um_filter_35_11]